MLKIHAIRRGRWQSPRHPIDVRSLATATNYYVTQESLRKSERKFAKFCHIGFKIRKLFFANWMEFANFFA